MRRLYFLLPDLEVTHKAVEELLLQRIDDRHIHVMARDDSELGDLPRASLAQRSDFIPGIERGITFGGATGIVAGLVALLMPEVVITGGAILAMGLVGAGMGAWAGGMIGLDVPNSQMRRFEQPLAQGQILLMVDVPKGRVHEIEASVRKHHPEAGYGGTEPTIPAFP
ncbi:hypothetical protein TspCOW1_10340 [Thiohalobacter sp. COW1]|uniref:DUF1269 domain-containing protein n=1 Tax=Thiohalobacter thiocyanaticus TaxID=585455 RepID=A0A1Z4VQT9_9GAMM|nr:MULTISPECIES: DUF1269 domain-containing protein [Thiohalobacter]BAZ94001.1 uncharacterized protein FOKN1_1613 [Thiohalobacter thiocyanaticus]BCO30931.1 hypothetical protein TspCOW1_10340 [Thiohalobacter sp. COW1]